jgi:hypothetical protein
VQGVRDLSEGTQYDHDSATTTGYKHVSYDNAATTGYKRVSYDDMTTTGYKHMSYDDATTMGYECVKFRQRDHNGVQACNLAMTGYLSIGGKGECLHGFEQLGRVCIHSVF